VRIAVVSPYSWIVPSGVNNLVTSLVSHLEELGHKVWVIAPAGTLFKRAKNLPPNLIVASRTFPVPSNGSVANVSVWPTMIRTMRRLLARNEFDLVHVHEPATPAVGAAAVLAAQIPIVGTFHAAGDATDYYQRWAPLAKRVLASISVRTAVSEAARDCVYAHFPGEYRVIPNGIDVRPYAFARNSEKVKRSILFLGRPEPRKGLTVLIEAFNNLRTRVPDLSLTLIGTSQEQLRALYPRAAGDLTKKLKGITALGRLSQEAKIKQMGIAEIMCAPSLGGESFGIVLTEAMAAGLPIVASDIRGYRDVLADGANGVLVPPGDVTALEEALFSTLSDTELRSRLSAAGIERAQDYSWNRVVTQMEEAYVDAMRIGPRVVEGPKVPVFKQTIHFMRMRSQGNKKPEAARGQAVG
jgi:phosphatidylinositol alpha-mannosyltransferase